MSGTLSGEQKVITCLWSELSGYWDRDGYSVKVENNATKLVLRGGHLTSVGVGGEGMDFVKNISYSCFLKKYPGPVGISIKYPSQ